MSMAVLGSGSKGNASAGALRIYPYPGRRWFECQATYVLRMNALGCIAPEQLDAILITHEHSDHAQGVDVLLRQRSVPVFANALTREALSHKMKSTITWKVIS